MNRSFKNGETWYRMRVAILGIVIAALVSFICLIPTKAKAEEDVNFCAHRARVMEKFAEYVQKTQGDFYDLERERSIMRMIRIIEGKDCNALRERYHGSLPRLREELAKIKEKAG